MAKTQKTEPPKPAAKELLSSRAAKWSEIFAALDKAGVPEDFLSDRDETLP
jgi:hypothetical protein